jgi:hypothetical protein
VSEREEQELGRRERFWQKQAAAEAKKSDKSEKRFSRNWNYDTEPTEIGRVIFLEFHDGSVFAGRLKGIVKGVALKFFPGPDVKTEHVRRWFYVD